jgi:hypothetical protein
MKNFSALLVLILLTGSVISAQTVDKSKHLKPANFQKKVTTVVSGNDRSYYSLSDQQPSVISVQGPGILEIMTRGRFEPGQGDYISYEILYTVDGGEQAKFKARDAERSVEATYQNGTLGVPGQRKDFKIELGRGDHTIEFYLKAVDIPVAVQYVFTPTKEKKRDWIEISPSQPSQPVDLISKESTTGYYRFSEINPLRITINGPTELRVFTRVEFSLNMQGRVNFRIQVIEGEKVLNTYQMSSTRSEVTEYKNEKELTPGKAGEFVIEIPSGSHTYKIVPLDQDKNTLLGRFLIPKEDVKLPK